MKKDKLSRIDPEFEEDMREMARVRVQNKLAEPKPTGTSLREMTKLLRKTDSYLVSLEELKFKPKKK